MQGFTTDNDHALEQLFGEHSEGTRDYDACIDIIAARLSTVFASLKVCYPSTSNFVLTVCSYDSPLLNCVSERTFMVSVSNWTAICEWRVVVRTEH